VRKARRRARLCRMLLYEIEICLYAVDNKRDIGGGGGSRTAVPKQRNESQNRHSNPSLHFAPVLPLVPERHSAHPRRSQQIWSISYRRYETNPRFSSRYTGRECENEINQATLPACCYPIYAPNQVVFRARSRLILIDSLTPFVPVGL
jgi:hypothetical protein